MSELTVLQAVRLKGRVGEEDLIATLDEDPTEVAATLTDLTAAGLLIQNKTLRVSPEGRERLNLLLAEERSEIDHNALAKSYDDFRAVNSTFKALVSDWQIKDGQPNPHDDADYDTAVLNRLDDVHEQVSPIVAAVTALVPRLSAYGKKLAAALGKVKAGDTAWLARPIIDSYHTVWFELHEELIAASGLTREEEAKAGHAS
ncbi:MarR family transcriptional regulator [Mycobacterium sp. Aquia_216]|uniref:MarR family transcriptional regulator n=1 Tax=Mycobacterium sp. Aquia_216 TaxID=2991729 RepID=UPI00227B6B02|nr:MarR family transcriptional regulator [Mycobacterium sp. Aquia_216]WAJ43442.1 MarR family transcriptional regulator [Mycobacterium sp. Aquia_216]